MIQQRVLIVERDRSIRSLLCAVLGRAGYLAEGVPAAAEAIDRVSSTHYDAVIVDVMPGDTQAEELLGRLSGLRTGSRFVVLLHSRSPAGAAALPHAAVESIFRKPFDIYELLDAVRRCAAKD